MCHLKGKYHSDAAIDASLARIAALYRIAAVTASAANKAAHTGNRRSTRLREGCTTVTVGVGRIAA
jgi:hypothetical protein